MTHLRRAMLEELQRRNYSTTTVQYYLQTVEQFAQPTSSISSTSGRTRPTFCRSETFTRTP